MDIDQTLKKLTLEQKCALLSGKGVFNTRSYPALGIPEMILADGPHGIRRQAGSSDHLGLNPSVPATCYPSASTVACSWNEPLVREIGRLIGEEAKVQGVGVVLGPGLNMKRSPLCGRNFEYYSEDPVLAGKMAAALVQGIQDKGVAACPKHYAVNNQETLRMVSDSIVDERTLREIYLTAFEIVIKESRPDTIMTSYNLVNGTYANENKHLLMDILRHEWGFDGMVVTDWGCSNDHTLGVKAGSTLEMPAPGGDSVRELQRAIKEGRLTEADVDERCRELLKVVYKTTDTLKQAPSSFDTEKHHRFAREAAAQSITLLRNEGGILPLEKGARVVVIGDFATNPRFQGAGSSTVNCTKIDNFLGCLKEAEVQVSGFAQGFERFGKTNEALLEEARTLAASAEVAILYLGLDEVQESEGLDRKHLRLADNQLKVLQAVAGSNPNTVVVLSAGCAVEVPFLKDCKALLYVGLGGQAGASAVVDVLMGHQNPAGKLAETWPLSLSDVPVTEHFAGDTRLAQYREGPYIGYRYYLTANVPVAFPFGFGLSYTSFAYRDLKADEKQVSFFIKNVGTRQGAEVAQLYVSNMQSEVFGPIRELKGFARAVLAPGEEQQVIIPLDDRAFRYYNTMTKQWEIQGGQYLLSVGINCETQVLQTQVTVQGTGAPNPYQGTDLVCYQSARIKSVPDQQFETLLGRKIPKEQRKINRHMTLGEMKYSRSPLGILAGFILSFLLKRSLKKGKANLNLLFLNNMPLHALAKMSNGMVSSGMVDGIVMELQGFWVVGLLRVLFELVKNQILNARLEKRLNMKK